MPTPSPKAPRPGHAKPPVAQHSSTWRDLVAFLAVLGVALVLMLRSTAGGHVDPRLIYSAGALIVLAFGAWLRTRRRTERAPRSGRWGHGKLSYSGGRRFSIEHSWGAESETGETQEADAS